MQQNVHSSKILKVLFIGDIFGKSGRKIISKVLPELKKQYSIDLVIANAENSAHGKGVTDKILNQLIEYGVDFFTLGNHSWAKIGDFDTLFQYPLIRPLNLQTSFKYYSRGEGSKEIECNGVRIKITNLLGNSVRFKGNQTNCFIAFSKLLDQLNSDGFRGIHIVDLHAETTSEKNAFLWAFNGRVSAILGTHTHVPTNDCIVTTLGTAYITDVGMTGPSCGIIGGERNSIIQKFFYPEKTFVLEPQEGPKQLCSVLITFDLENYKAVDIKPIIIREGFEVDIYKATTIS